VWLSLAQMNRLQLGMEGSLSCMLEVQSGCLKPHGAKAIDYALRHSPYGLFGLCCFCSATWPDFPKCLAKADSMYRGHLPIIAGA